MAAFNWVEVVASCPACCKPSTLRCQAHFASSYGGDETGRFHNRTYRLGERMAWWREVEDEFAEWKAHSSLHLGESGGDATECCYSYCTQCKTWIFVVLRYENFTPIEATNIGCEDDWPSDFLR